MKTDNQFVCAIKTHLRGIGKALLLLAMVCCCDHSYAQHYLVHGQVKGIGDGWAFLRHRQTGEIDSSRMQGGRFTFSGNISAPEFCTFGFSVNGVKDYFLSFFLEKGEFNMSVSKDSLNDTGIVFTGSKVEKEFQEFQRQVKRINDLHYPSSKADTALSLQAKRFALKHPGSYVSAFALNSYETSLAELTRLYAQLAPEIQRSYYGLLIYKQTHP